MQQKRFSESVTAINTSIKKEITDNLTLHLKELQEQTKPKVSRGMEIIKIRAETNKIQNRKITEKINKTNSCFFEKINKIEKPLTRLTKKERKFK